MKNKKNICFSKFSACFKRYFTFKDAKSSPVFFTELFPKNVVQWLFKFELHKTSQSTKKKIF